jgi:UDP-N-acetylmuramyl tripeptide synthase
MKREFNVEANTGRTITIQLSKNPAGFNQSVSVAQEIIEKNGGNILLVLNDRIPDGTDISWIWDVELEEIRKFTEKVFVSGDRVYDMALRMKYGGFEKIETDEVLENAIEKVVSATPEGGTVVILCTYSAMLEVRKIIIGRKLL